jgi:hypothetical protein
LNLLWKNIDSYCDVEYDVLKATEYDRHVPKAAEYDCHVPKAAEELFSKNDSLWDNVTQPDPVV